MNPAKVIPVPETDRPTSPFDQIAPAPVSNACYHQFPFSLGEELTHFRLARRMPRAYWRKLEETRDQAREFTDRHLRPRALEIERQVSRDPRYFDWELMRRACDFRFFSMLIPEAFEGLGCSVLHMATMAEELAVGCAGVASTIGVHSAGISCGMLSLDPVLLEKYIRPVAQSEKRGEPVLWAGAVTEPNAGTDIWDEDFLKVARIMTFAKKVPGGYRLTGRKCFISNGSVAQWIAVAAALDPRHLLESWTVFVVRADSPGFSVGRVEKKMGQKASPAAELIFEDVFVPEELRVGEEGSGGRNVSIYLSASRGPVGAIGTGCARRALECLVDWAKQHQTGRGRLIDQQALQLTLARMASEIEQARQAYVAAALACDEILSDILGHPLTRITLTGLPGAAMRHPFGQAALKSRPVKAIMNWIRDSAAPDDRLAQVSCLATIAKCKGSDVGVRVSGEAMRIMGHDSLDPRWPVEKCYRDAKLTQIYEGTNEANTITLFKDMARTWRA